jgi:type II secretory pathway component PulF
MNRSSCISSVLTLARAGLNPELRGVSLTLREKQSLYHSLAQLVRTGIPFPKALDKLVVSARGDQRRLIETSRKSLAEGHTVGEAFAKTGGAVTVLEVAVISAVEKSGQLDRGLSELSAYFGSLDKARKAILTRCAYPVFLLHFGIFALSAPTIFLKDVHHFWVEVGTALFFVYGTAAIIALLVPLLRDGAAANAGIDRLLITLPVLGNIRRFFALSRFCTVYGLQLEAGINVIDSLLNAGRASRSGLARSAADEAAPQVRNGSPVGPLLAASGAFPTEFTQGLIVGEETGSLDDELRRMATEYRERALSALEIFSEWLPKLIYVGVVLFLAWKILAIASGYYKSIDNLLK